tara:strand:- start:398 stop:826 length:429 start_codon:yes stop_codon:yes gene_type:complete
MASLTNNKVQDTYKGIIKTTDSAEITGEVQLSDGDGNTIPVYVNTDSVKFSGKLKDKDSATGTAGQVLKSTGSQVQWIDVRYTHSQSVASATWSVTHNLATRPSVTIVNTAEEVVYAEIEYTSDNAVTITFTNAQSGKAYFN